MVAIDRPMRPERPTIRPVSIDAVYGALAAGWEDFRAAPRFGLFFGGIYAGVGILLFLALWSIGFSIWIVPFAVAFPLFGPFAAIGFYEVSRRRERGLSLEWSEILGVVWEERNRQLPSMAFVVLSGVMIWMWAASFLIIIFAGDHSGSTLSDIDRMLSSDAGVSLLVVGTIIGGIIAFALFSVTALSLPLLLDHDIDVVTAMITSATAVRRNLPAMLHWAWIIAAMLFVAMVPFFLGLVVALPVLGHATWHLYRQSISFDDDGN